MAEMTPFEVRYYSIHRKTRVNDTECYDLHVFANDALAEIARLAAERDELRIESTLHAQEARDAKIERDAAVALAAEHEQTIQSVCDERDAAWNEAIEAAVQWMEETAGDLNEAAQRMADMKVHYNAGGFVEVRLFSRAYKKAATAIRQLKREDTP